MRRIYPVAVLFLTLFCFADTVNYAYDDAGRLVRVTYGSGKSIFYTYDKAGNLLRRLVTTTLPGPNPAITAAGVVNAASFLGGPVAAGEIVTLFGTGMGPATLVGLSLTRAGFVDTFLSDAQVLFDGTPSPLIYVSANQTSAIVPYAVAGKSSTQLQIEYQGRRSTGVSLPVAAAAPALFSLNASGKGGGAILNQDSSVNAAANPADKGSIVVLFGTGEGQTTPGGTDGKLAAGTFPKPLLSVSVKIGGLDADILYAGAAPGLVAGVLQVNAKVPDGVASGAVPVVL
ncbi:MAG: IPT/TIG domain-containing protein, partial [Acidobacteria bacterium]|nr:IPT/TIG domain-containing protein [Acidobacteriota bacterium]